MIRAVLFALVLAGCASPKPTFKPSIFERCMAVVNPPVYSRLAAAELCHKAAVQP